MTKKYRTIWISDLHLGTRGCKIDYLLDFIKNNESEYLYLVGDIIDFWRLRVSLYWPQSHNDFIQKILRKARKGTKVIYILGNHDESLKDFSPLNLGENVFMMNEIVHMTADGKRLWVVHGDAFDGITRYHKWLAFMGDHAYTFLLWVNTYLNKVRKYIGKDYWSLSAYLKHKAKTAVSFINEFEKALSHECKARKYDGVICGHIHHAEIKKINDVDYYNTGDFVESCTALVEHYDGKIELIKWAEIGHGDIK